MRVSVFFLLATMMLVSANVHPVRGEVVGFQDFDGGAINLLGFETSANVPDGGFATLGGAFRGDAFEVIERQVSESIPFNLSDDSVSAGVAGEDPFASDTNGMLGVDKDNDAVFGITDTWNDNTNNTEVTGTWTFDVSGATAPLFVSADMAAMNDFAGSTVNSNVDFFYQLDDNGFLPLFTSTISLGETQEYLMDSGETPVYEDPLNMNGIRLTDEFQVITSALIGNGSTLDIQVRTNMDGSESFAFDNLTVTAVPEPSSFLALGLISMAAVRSRRRSAG